MCEDAAVAAISCSFRGYLEEVTEAADTKHTVDADHPTRTLTLSRTLWSDLCLDAKRVPRVCRYGDVVVSLLGMGMDSV